MVVRTGTKDTRINQREVRTRLKNAVRQRHEVWISWHVEHRLWLKKGWWSENNRERLEESES